MSSPQDFNQSVITEFRANAGRVGGRLADVDLMLLTHTGARTGRALTTPLGHLVDGDDLVIVAANRGSAQHPSWYHNLVANPQVTVELGTESFPAVAHVAADAEQARLRDFVVAAKPFFLDFAAKAAPREIPIVVLRRA